MPKTGRNMYKRKDGRWEGRYPKGRDAAGNIMYGYVYGKTCTEVKQRLAALTMEESLPIAPAVAVEKSNATFADVTSQWLSVIAMQVKPSTYAGYTAALDLHIRPSLGNRKMQKLTAVDVSRFARDKLENGRADGNGGLSSKTVRDMLSIIKAITDFAFEQNIIGSRIKMPIQPAIRRFKLSI